MIKVRLAKFGRKNAPTFRVVVSNERDTRNGRYLDMLGAFNPSDKKKPSIDMAKYDEWINKGAQPTPAVTALIAGKYQFVPYVRSKAEVQAQEAQAQEVKETPAEKPTEAASPVEEVTPSEEVKE